jgi:pimeloyl-ACP methyl ester carboxylesterase
MVQAVCIFCLRLSTSIAAQRKREPPDMAQPLPLTYLEAGEALGGTPLLVIHGLFGSARNWATLARRFGERQRVYALDLRNHGSSPGRRP